jgi:hypothetical protein
MTSERQRAANRENARKSTGPKSQAGKARASRNALRHGLTSRVVGGPNDFAAMEQLAREIEQSSGGRIDLADARMIAAAEIEVWRARSAINAVRDPMPEPAGPPSLAPNQAPLEVAVVSSSAELKKLDRYMGRAVSKRDKAIRFASQSWIETMCFASSR